MGRGHASGLRSLGRLAAEQEPTCCVCTNSGRAGGGQSRPRVGWAPRPPGGREPRSSGLKLPTYPQGNYREQPGGVCEEHIHSGAWVKEASYWQLKAPRKCRARCWTPWASPGGHRALSAASPLPSTKQPLPPSRFRCESRAKTWKVTSSQASACAPLTGKLGRKRHFSLPAGHCSEDSCHSPYRVKQELSSPSCACISYTGREILSHCATLGSPFEIL